MHQLKFDLIEEEDRLKEEYAASIENEFRRSIDDTSILATSNEGKELNLRETSIAEMNFNLAFLDEDPVRYHHSEKYIFSMTDEKSITKHKDGNIVLYSSISMLFLAGVITITIFFVPNASFSLNPNILSQQRASLADDNFLSHDFFKKGIPVLLYNSDSSLFNITSILSDCFELKSAPITSISQKKTLNKSLEELHGKKDFYMAESFCDIPKKIMTKSNIRLFLVLQNPALQMLEQQSNQFSTKKNHDNPLTRSIICKMRGKLTFEDFEVASNRLRDMSYVGTNTNIEASIKMFKKKFKWKVDYYLHGNCVSQHFVNEMQWRKVVTKSNHDVEKALSLNVFDMSLYYEHAFKKSYRNLKKIALRSLPTTPVERHFHI